MSQNLKNKSVWYKSKIIKGRGIAKTLGFPTINLENADILNNKQEGVYLCRLRLKINEYFGLLYYGPRLVLDETHRIIEIYIIDFEEAEINSSMEFKLLDFIRPVLDFENLESLKVQIDKDFDCARAIILNTSN